MIKALKTLADICGTRLKNRIIFTYRDYITFKHGEKSDICVLSGGKQYGGHFVRFDTSHADAVIVLDALPGLRKMIGENVLRVYGLPAKEEETPYVYILPTLSAIRTIGIRNFIDFYRNNWKGDSKVGGLTVVIYK